MDQATSLLMQITSPIQTLELPEVVINSLAMADIKARTLVFPLEQNHTHAAEQQALVKAVDALTTTVRHWELGQTTNTTQIVVAVVLTLAQEQTSATPLAAILPSQELCANKAEHVCPRMEQIVVLSPATLPFVCIRMCARLILVSIRLVVKTTLSLFPKPMLANLLHAILPLVTCSLILVRQCAHKQQTCASSTIATQQQILLVNLSTKPLSIQSPPCLGLTALVRRTQFMDATNQLDILLVSFMGAIRQQDLAPSTLPLVVAPVDLIQSVMTGTVARLTHVSVWLANTQL